MIIFPSRINKTVAPLLIAVLIFVQLFAPIFAPSAAAAAPLTVPVLTNPPGPGILSMDTIKSYILKLAVKIAMAVLIRTLTNQIISWIQGNNGQNVGFVGNLENAFDQSADAAGGQFLQQLALTPQPPGCTPGVNCKFNGIDICTANMRQFLQISLRTPGIRQQLGCTLSDIGAKAENFFQDFQQGGWPAFIKIGLEPQNNPYGAYLIALDAKVAAEDRAGRTVGAQYQANKGFLGFAVDRNTNCRPVSEDEANAVQTIQGFGGRDKQKVITTTDGPLQERELCDVVQDVKTPGALVADTLSKAVGSGIDFGVATDEIDAAINAIVSTLITKIITASSGVFEGGDHGLSTPELGNLQFEPKDVQSSALQTRLDAVIFQADNALAALNQTIIATQQILFAARKQISDLTAQIKSMQNQPSSSERDKQIKDLQDQLASNQKTAADSETKLTTQLEVKKDVIASETELMGVKNDFVNAGTPGQLADATTLIEPAIARLNDATGKIENASSAASVPAGSAKKDTKTELMSAEKNARDEISLFTDLLAEIDRLIASPDTTAAQKDLLTGQSGKRTKVAAEITHLNEQLVALTNLESRLNAATTDDDIRFARQDIINRILVSDRELATANTTMAAIIPILKP